MEENTLAIGWMVKDTEMVFHFIALLKIPKMLNKFRKLEQKLGHMIWEAIDPLIKEIGQGDDYKGEFVKGKMNGKGMHLK